MRLECSSAISADYNLHLPGSNNSLASTSGHHAQLIFVFLVETGSYHVGQAGRKLLTSGVAHFGSLRRGNRLSIGVQDQPGQHGKILSLQKILKSSQAWWCAPAVPATLEAGHFRRLRRTDCLSQEVRDQPGQHDKTPSLLKIQKLAQQGTGDRNILGRKGQVPKRNLNPQARRPETVAQNQEIPGQRSTTGL
ncbi:hypothetical protein AAY473_028437 [Plecturocebus cupreus]